MTHTLETTAISRVVARALRLNEDLTEAIGLGHDMGHTPFGHAGEDALDAALQERFGRRFRHNEQSLLIALAQPHTRGLRRDPHTHGGARARDARGEDRAARRPRRVHQPRHRRRRAVRAAERGRPATPRDRRPRAHRLEPNRHARPRHRGRVGRRRRHTTVAEVGEAMLSLRAFMFERATRTARAPEHARAHEVAAESSTASSNAATMQTRSSTTSPG